MEKFKVGDKVKFIKPSRATEPYLKKDYEYAIKSISPGGNFYRTDDGINGMMADCFELIELESNYKENKMKKYIIENYGKSSDASLVEDNIPELRDFNDFIIGLIVSDHKEKILAEAKRREEEANKTNED